MECPACAHPLEPLQVQEVALDRCSRCHFIWFDARELEQFLALISPGQGREDAPVSEILLRDTSVCPRCKAKRLKPGHWHAIPMALCSACSGILLAESSLEAMRGAWAQRPRPQPNPRFAWPERDATDEAWSAFFFSLADLLSALLSHH